MFLGLQLKNEPLKFPLGYYMSFSDHETEQKVANQYNNSRMFSPPLSLSYPTLHSSRNRKRMRRVPHLCLRCFAVYPERLTMSA